MDDRRTLTVAETARVLGLSRPTVYQLIHSEGFPAFKVGTRTLISSDGLDEWIKKKVGGGVRL